MKKVKIGLICKKIICLSLVAAGLSVSAFARDVTERKVEKMDSWQESFDINAKKGKYNVMVTASDLGGNKTVAGPFNIYIDPKSDLPVCGITNPVKGLRVPGNLNIVGTCVDDDAVDYVELILDGDTEHPVRATGKDFWSYFLNTEKLAEGDHTIEVYGVDVNGLRGNSIKTVWCLDRQVPATEVTNIGLGTIVSGNVTFSGTISDGNGIAALAYSLDGGAHFTSVNVKNNKKTNTADFKFAISTNRLNDGPAVIWFKATDLQGSVGYYSFLCFIDNTKPDLEIVSPQDKTVQNGVFSIAGYAKDAIGIKSLTWEYAGEKGEFELTPGNPYWTKEITSGKPGKLIVTATDTAGNVTKKERDIKIDTEADKPVASITWPVAGANLVEGTFFVRGYAKDDDGLASVKINIDGKEAAVIETKGVFIYNIEDERAMSYGKHTVGVIPVDKYGVAGNEVKSEYFSQGLSPKFESPRLKTNGTSSAFNFGQDVNPESNSTFEIEASSSSGIKEAKYEISWSNDRFGNVTDGKKEEKALDIKSPVGKVGFSIPVETLPWGMVHLKFTVVDTLDRVTNYGTSVYVYNLTKIVEKPRGNYNASIDDETAKISFSDVNDEKYTRGMNVVVPSTSKSAAARWNLGQDLNAKKNPVQLKLNVETASKEFTLGYRIYYGGEAGGSVAAEGKANFIRDGKDSPTGVAYIPLDGLAAELYTIEVTAISGKTYSEKCYAQLGVIRQMNPDFINDGNTGLWQSYDNTVYDAEQRMFIMGSNGTISGITNLEGMVNATITSRSTGLEIIPVGRGFVLRATEDGIYSNVTVRVTNDQGQRVDFAPVSFVTDTKGPQFTMQRPGLFEWVRGRLLASGVASDATGIKSLEYSIDNGETWKTIVNNSKRATVQISIDENLSNVEDGIVPLDIRGTDISGNVSYFRTVVQKDTKAPEVQVIVPGVEEKINGINTISFIAKDEGNLEKIEYVSSDGRRRQEIVNSSMITTQVGTPEQPIDNRMQFIFTDSAGNATTKNTWEFLVDNKSDLPIANIQLPTENEVVTKDFVISGVVLDDDGPSKIYYKIDNGRYVEIPGMGYSFSVNVPLSEMTDNEHNVTVYAVDINGVRGPENTRKFRVSLAEPVGRMTDPAIETTQSKITTLTGTASDGNGIKKVEVSLDNGNTYNLATGTTNWKYTFDTRTLPDGTHVVFLKTTDNYDIESLYSSLINIDNTKPELSLEFPLDDSKTTGPVFFSGYTLDNIGLTELYITVTNLDGRAVPSRLARTNLVPDKIITTTVDLSSLENGNYNVKLTGLDAAGNITSVSRNIILDKRVAEAEVDIYYPMNGETKRGEFNIYGEVISGRKVNNVSLVMDGKVLETVDLNRTRYYKFGIDSEKIAAGKHTYSVRASLEGGLTVESINQTVDFEPYGPWVTIDNFAYGDFAIERPWIKGRVGYTVDPEELAKAKEKGAEKEFKDEVAAKTPSVVEISLDNGKTFKKLNSNGKTWKYRVENEDMEEGYHFIFVRTTMKNGETAINRVIVQIDKTTPFVKIIAPSIGGRYNQELEMSGLASDKVGLERVALALRKGDKAAYEVPAFFRGMYIDGSFWGATLFNVGVGLSFFDDNVKLQFQYGQFTQEQRAIFAPGPMRYGGHVIGGKIIANVAYLPFRIMFGPDWDWLSLGVALGANFSYFTETASGKGQFLSAILGQIEFPRVTFKKAKAFRTISLYTEFQLWFIPSDVVGGDDIANKVFQVSEGIRINIF